MPRPKAPPPAPGTRFGKLTVIGPAEPMLHRGRPTDASECLCDCGETRTVKNLRLRDGPTKSCLRCRGDSTTHGHASNGSTSKEYRTWNSIRMRCTKPSQVSYKHYGAKGIKVCSRWMNSFENFLADMGQAPSKDHSIDRIDSAGDYEPSNCRWATSKEQARNTSRNKTYMVGGVVGCLIEHCDRYGISPSTAHCRMSRGWSPEEAFEVVPRKKWQTRKHSPLSVISVSR